MQLVQEARFEVLKDVVTLAASLQVDSRVLVLALLVFLEQLIDLVLEFDEL